MRGHGRGRSRYPPKRSGVAEGDVNQGCGTRENEASRAGLDPDGVYVSAEWVEGRANRPFLVGIPRRPKGGVREADALAGVRAPLPRPWPHDVRQTSTSHQRGEIRCGRNRISPCRRQPEGAATRGADLSRESGRHGVPPLPGRRNGCVATKRTPRRCAPGGGAADLPRYRQSPPTVAIKP